MDLFSCLEGMDGNVAWGQDILKVYTITHTLSREEKVEVYTVKSGEDSQSSLKSLDV